MSNVLSTLKGRVTAASYAAAWWLVCRVPESWGRWVFQQAGEIAWRRQGPGVQLLEANLRRVIGPEPSGKELRALSLAGMQLLRPVLVRGLPAAGDQRRAARR